MHEYVVVLQASRGAVNIVKGLVHYILAAVVVVVSISRYISSLRVVHHTTKPIFCLSCKSIFQTMQDPRSGPLLIRRKKE